MECYGRRTVILCAVISVKVIGMQLPDILHELMFDVTRKPFKLTQSNVDGVGMIESRFKLTQSNVDGVGNVESRC